MRTLKTQIKINKRLNFLNMVKYKLIQQDILTQIGIKNNKKKLNLKNKQKIYMQWVEKNSDVVSMKHYIRLLIQMKLHNRRITLPNHRVSYK